MLASKGTAASVSRRLPNRQAALTSLYGDIAAKSMFPFWATSTDVAHDEIRQLMGTQKAVPHLWSYRDDIEPTLLRAAELVTMDDSERRSLILVNPGLAPRRASVTTMYTAYRLNDPKEVMPPHRHTASAVRFGLTGKQNLTGVEGEDIVFGPGDLVLTPRDTWHNHGNLGDAPAVNLSVLDYPLIETLNDNEIPFDLSKAENVLTMKDTGSRILLRAVDEFERLRGTNLAWFGLDELTYTMAGAWLRLEGRLRDPVL